MHTHMYTHEHATYRRNTRSLSVPRCIIILTSVCILSIYRQRGWNQSVWNRVHEGSACRQAPAYTRCSHCTAAYAHRRCYKCKEACTLFRCFSFHAFSICKFPQAPTYTRLFSRHSHIRTHDKRSMHTLFRFLHLICTIHLAHARITHAPETNACTLFRRKEAKRVCIKIYFSRQCFLF